MKHKPVVMEGDGSSLGNSLLSHWYPVISQYHWVKSLTSQFWWLNHVESQFQITSFWWWNRPLFNAKSFFFHEQILIFYRLNHIVFGCFKHICLWFSLSHHFSWGKSSLLKLQRLLSPASAGFVLLQPMAGKMPPPRTRCTTWKLGVHFRKPLTDHVTDVFWVNLTQQNWKNHRVLL